MSQVALMVMVAGKCIEFRFVLSIIIFRRLVRFASLDNIICFPVHEPANEPRRNSQQDNCELRTSLFASTRLRKRLNKTLMTTVREVHNAFCCLQGTDYLVASLGKCVLCIIGYNVYHIYDAFLELDVTT